MWPWSSPGSSPSSRPARIPSAFGPQTATGACSSVVSSSSTASAKRYMSSAACSFPASPGGRGELDAVLEQGQVRVEQDLALGCQEQGPVAPARLEPAHVVRQQPVQERRRLLAPSPHAAPVALVEEGATLGGRAILRGHVSEGQDARRLAGLQPGLGGLVEGEEGGALHGAGSYGTDWLSCCRSAAGSPQLLAGASPAALARVRQALRAGGRRVRARGRQGLRRRAWPPATRKPVSSRGGEGGGKCPVRVPPSAPDPAPNVRVATPAAPLTVDLAASD